MATHDGIIDNQPFPAFRSDLNAAILALLTNSSSATAPTTTYAYQFWVDTTTSRIRQRNAGNTAWIEIGTIDVPNWGLAALASPAFTGLPTCPTASSGTSSQQIASTAMVQSAISTVGSWVTPTLVNSWTAAYSEPIGYRRRQQYTVEFRGSFTKASIAGNVTETIFTLPAGFRPNGTRRFTGMTSSAVGLVPIIDSTGAVSVYSYNALSNPIVSFDGWRFTAEV